LSQRQLGDVLNLATISALYTYLAGKGIKDAGSLLAIEIGFVNEEAEVQLTAE